jgi:2-polyprenyl-6-methoxyphenol hydroxylase-like FAD-dependent oxidoreductase
MPDSARPLIVGAGPVGKAAALFLARQGIATRLIDSADAPSPYSKALAVNPRTLEILEPSGVTERMLALGRPMRGGRFWSGDRLIAEVSFTTLRHKYPFMLALSQATTERLLEDALLQAGGSVERQVALATCQNADDHVEAEIKHAPGDRVEQVRCSWLLAADGAHSAVRHALAVDFAGSTFAQPWYLADLPLETSLADDCAHIAFLHGFGFVFAIPVIDDQLRTNPPLWRVLANVENPAAHLPHSRAAGEAVWTSTFRISHRINAHLQVGNVAFAGDAAHIHSPVGARGMNLGIEDAWVFSRLVVAGQRERYEALRRPVDELVVKRVARVSRVVRGESLASCMLRQFVARVLSKVTPLRRQVLAVVTGLDHALPPDLAP